MDDENGHNNDNNYINGINILSVPRLRYDALVEISQLSGSRINARAYNPHLRTNHYKMNSHAKFKCFHCNNKWSSNKVTVELWWIKKKWEFDVRMYGQRCKRCNRHFMIPRISRPNLRRIINICVRKLTTRYNFNGGQENTNENTNTEFNDSHDQTRCMKCIMIGRPCWGRRNLNLHNNN